jgi:hypothetical protein
MPNFHIEGRMKNQRDIQHDFMFEVCIPNIASIVSSVKDDEPFILRAKTASIPDRSNTPIESYFMGMTQYFPGRLTLGSTLNVDFEEGQDQVMTKALYDWQDRIFNIDELSDNGGHAMADGKRNGLSTDIYVKMYKYNGDLMENMIRCYNAWPTSVGESPLDMSSNNAVRRSVIFQFDFWKLVTP